MPEPSPLRQLLDRQEIMAAMAAYTRCADLNEPEQQAAVFTEDCRVRYHPAKLIVGPAALVQALRAAGADGRDANELPSLGRASGALA